jgi:hypothetical protein
VQKETHAAPGRQVLTWAHVVKSTEVNHIGGSLMYSVILCLSLLGSRVFELFSSASASAYPHAPLESVICDCNCTGVHFLFPIPVNFVWPLCFDLDIPTHTREITQWEGKLTCVFHEPRFIHTANMSSCLNCLGCCPVYYPIHVAS